MAIQPIAYKRFARGPRTSAMTLGRVAARRLEDCLTCGSLGGDDELPAGETTVTTRRAMGALEDEVMAYLWATESPATPAEVHQAVAPELAYTTVMTVLTRLWTKEVLTREAKGRGFTYSPVRSEAQHRADLMQDALRNSADRAAVLSSFVASLSRADAKKLRTLLRGELS
ncbi:MAG: BlaI/MecI/CopY family transcriptional regulator [Acidimicrobiia bacterium]|nr:BlaI/MecI/CopY family transcriptional regulator [Acidimicrobiia bacterium]